VPPKGAYFRGLEVPFFADQAESVKVNFPQTPLMFSASFSYSEIYVPKDFEISSPSETTVVPGVFAAPSRLHRSCRPAIFTAPFDSLLFACFRGRRQALVSIEKILNEGHRSFAGKDDCWTNDDLFAFCKPPFFLSISRSFAL